MDSKNDVGPHNGESISKIIIGCDHAAYPQKQELIDMIKKDYDIEIVDVGCDSDKSCHYPDYAHKACELALNERNARVILLCASGTGMNIVANKHNGIRCVHGHKIFQVALARQHNNVNGLAMGIKLSEMSDMKAMVETFLDTDFEGADSQGNPTRHALRVSKIENKIEELANLSNDVESSYMSNVSKLDDVTKRKPKRTRSLGVFRKKDNVYPVKVKLNKQPFQPRELPPPPAEDTALFTKTDFYLNHKDEIEHSDTDSMKVQVEQPSEIDNIVNEKLVGATVMSLPHTPDKTEDELMEEITQDDNLEDKALDGSEENIKINISKFDILNDIKVDRKVKSKSTKKDERYVPSVGEPVRDLSKKDDEQVTVTVVDDKSDEDKSKEDEVDDDKVDDDKVDDDKSEVVNENEVESTERDVAIDIIAFDKKMEEARLESKNNKTTDVVDGDTILDKYEDDMMAELTTVNKLEEEGEITKKEDIERVKKDIMKQIKALHDQQQRSKIPRPTATLVKTRTESIALPPKIPLVKESSSGHVPFNKNNVSTIDNIVPFTSTVNVPMDKAPVMVPLNSSKPTTTDDSVVKSSNRSLGATSQKDATNGDDKKIETDTSSNKRSLTTKQRMPEKLTYPTSIDTNNTKLADMINYMNNCNEVNKLEQDIMHKIVELRERMKLIKRDLRAEMDCAFDLDDEETPSGSA